jgi:hypothetical protein
LAFRFADHSGRHRLAPRRCGTFGTWPTRGPPDLTAWCARCSQRHVKLHFRDGRRHLRRLARVRSRGRLANFAQIDSQVQTEANLVGNLYRDTVAFPEPSASRLRHFLFVYAEIVVQDEWPALAAGRADEAPGWQLMDKFHTELLRFQANDESVGVLRADAIKTLNELYNARRGRFQAATSELPPILWWNLIAGAVILMMFTYLFGVPRLWMHLATVSLLGALIGLIMALVVLLNNPFRGQNHVSIAPFHRLVKSVETMAYPHD